MSFSRSNHFIVEFYYSFKQPSIFFFFQTESSYEAMRQKAYEAMQKGPRRHRDSNPD